MTLILYIKGRHVKGVILHTQNHSDLLKKNPRNFTIYFYLWLVISKKSVEKQSYFDTPLKKHYIHVVLGFNKIHPLRDGNN